MTGNRTRVATTRVRIAATVRRTIGWCVAVMVASAGCGGARASAPPQARLERLRAWGEGHRDDLVRELAAMVAVPSVSRRPNDVRRLADRLEQAFEAVGLTVEDLAQGGPPLLLAATEHRRGRPTLLFYAHYDGQNADPAQWSACSPFEPVLLSGPPGSAVHLGPAAAAHEFPEDARLCGRAAADDKGPIAVLLLVLRGIRDLDVGPMAVNVKVLLDGEEESGSPHLEAALSNPRTVGKLATDVVVSLDGPVHPSGKPTVVLGVRGITTFDLTTYGGHGDLHSGHYGNIAPNPALELGWLLATMKDPSSGEVKLAGFHDCRTPLSAADEAALKAVPDVGPLLRELHGLSRTEDRWSVAEAVTWPALNVRGLAAADVGEGARTVIPARAEAALDIRLVTGCTPQFMLDVVRRHLEGLGYQVLSHDPTPQIRRSHPRLVKLVARPGGYPASRTRIDHPAVKAIVAAVEQATAGGVVRLPTMGGSLPFHRFEQQLRAPVVALPLVNFDNGQHGPDENVRLGNLFQGFDILATLLLSPPPPSWRGSSSR